MFLWLGLIKIEDFATANRGTIRSKQTWKKMSIIPITNALRFFRTKSLASFLLSFHLFLLFSVRLHGAPQSGRERACIIQQKANPPPSKTAQLLKQARAPWCVSQALRDVMASAIWQHHPPPSQPPAPPLRPCCPPLRRQTDSLS